MLRKFFPLDKNYVLEEAQLSLETSLLHYLVDFVKVEYLLRCNPLGMMDAMATKIQQHDNTDFRHLHQFYVNLTGVFRYKYYGDNQLEFIFEGKDAFNKYQEEWSRQFKAWTKAFCKHHNFLRAVLDLTVFYPSDSPVLMVDNRMDAFITQYFEVRIHPQKGIVKRMA
ncbi:MAG: hypothetical protein WA874_07690 [Chryseosolibacter sp.]